MTGRPKVGGKNFSLTLNDVHWEYVKRESERVGLTMASWLRMRIAQHMDRHLPAKEEG